MCTLAVRAETSSAIQRLVDIGLPVLQVVDAVAAVLRVPRAMNARGIIAVDHAERLGAGVVKMATLGILVPLPYPAAHLRPLRRRDAESDGW